MGNLAFQIVCKICHTKSRGFHDISGGEIHYRKFDLARNPPPVLPPKANKSKPWPRAKHSLPPPRYQGLVPPPPPPGGGSVRGQNKVCLPKKHLQFWAPFIPPVVLGREGPPGYGDPGTWRRRAPRLSSLNSPVLSPLPLPLQPHATPHASARAAPPCPLPPTLQPLQVITDIDDTVKSSGGVKFGGIPLGGIDTQYRRGLFYPGVFRFMLELASYATTEAPLSVAVLTARAREFLFALEVRYRAPPEQSPILLMPFGCSIPRPRDALERLTTTGEPPLDPPPLWPPPAPPQPLPLFEADRVKMFFRAFGATGFKLRTLSPAFGGDHRGPYKEGVSTQPPCPFSNPLFPPPLLLYTERPVFACRQAMQEHMRRLEVHCRALWARRLARPGRGRQEAFLNDYLPRPLGGRAPLRPFQRARPQRPRCPPAQPPPPARPAGAPRALGRGLGTGRVLCPAHGAATRAACAATGQGIKYCCSLGHEGHRLAPAAQRAGARALRAWLQAPQARCWAPEGGSRRGAHQRMSRRRRGGACCRRQCWGGGSGRHASAPPLTTSHRAGGPLLGLGHLSPTLPGTPTPTTHGGMRGGGGGRRGGGSATAAVPATGDQPQWLWPHFSWGAVAAGTPAGCVVGHNFTAPPPSNCGRVPRGGRGAGTGARKPCGRFWLHLGRAH